MAKRNLSEQLDRTITKLLARPAKKPLGADGNVPAEMRALAQVAASLRGLPREDFRARLKNDLQRRNTMASKPVPAAQELQTATAYLIVKDAAAAIDFYKKVFGAREIMRLDRPDGGIGHAEIRIGNTSIALSDEFPQLGGFSPQTIGGNSTKIIVYVADADAVARAAIAAGAKEVQPVADQFWGDRSGQVADPFGYTWIVSTHKEDLTPDEMQKRYDDYRRRGLLPGTKPESPAGESSSAVNPIPEGFHSLTQYLAVTGAANLIEFFKVAFGAQEKFRVNRPGAETIMHAQLQIGDSVLELADATDEFSARRTGSILHVEDVDAVYARALQAGATVLHPPVEQSYGDYEASVADPSGNFWYITRIRATDHRTEDTRTILPCLSLRGAAGFLEFAKQAFGAEEASVHKSPDGTVVHARVHIGDSLLAFGEAHGEYGPTPAALHLYVRDVDSVYATAVSAGAKVVRTLRDEPYGDRAAVLQDAFGNMWFPSTHIKDVKF